jgi:hypothetical protein
LCSISHARLEGLRRAQSWGKSMKS